MPAREARNGVARDTAADQPRRRAGTTPSATSRRGGAPAVRSDRPAGSAARSSARRAPGAARAAATAPAAPAEGLIVGRVPVVARVAGGLLALAGLVGAVAVFPTYLVVGGHEITIATGLGSALVAWLVPVTTLVMGGTLLRGRLPKLGLAYAGVAGALGLGQLLIELYRGSSSTSRPGVEVLAGERVITSSVVVGAGWVLGVVALGLTVLAGIVAGAAWGRTVMEDGGTLDPVRSSLAGAAALLGVGTVLCMALPAADVPDRLVTDPSTGMETVVTREGPQALLERPGLALLGGLLLAGAVVLCSVIAPSLRPRLAVVGGLLAITAAVLSAGLSGLRDAVVSADLVWTVPGAGLLVAGLGYGLLTLLAWRVRRAPGPAAG